MVAVRITVLVPTLVRVRALVSELVITPPNVMSPAVATPERALTRFEPTDVLFVSVMAPAQAAAVLLELMMAPWELTAPTPVIVPEPPKPEPAMVRASAPTLKPLRSRTAPEVTVVPEAVSLSAAA